MEEQTMPSREKYWKELTDSEKLERMREVVKSLMGTIDHLNRTADRLLSNFEQHTHIGEKLYVPIQRQSYGKDSLLRKSRTEIDGEVYF